MGGSSGFTLIELMVVVFILGILAFMGIPQYLKTVENAKADDAAAMVSMLGNANRIYNVNNNSAWTSGQLDNTSHVLITGKYVGAVDWTVKPYNFYSCNPNSGAGGGCCSSGAVSCALRKGSGETNGTGRSPYTNWGYSMSETGTVSVLGGAPTPPG